MNSRSLPATVLATAKNIDTSATTGRALPRVEDALRAHGCTRTGESSWTCPAHDDTTPSLSVRQGRLGAVLKCHAGCENEDIVKALGLTMAGLFDSPRTGTAPVNSTRLKPAGRGGVAPPKAPTYVRVLGEVTEGQVRWLKEDRRLRSDDTLYEVLAYRVRYLREEWIGFLLRGGSWKLWAVDGDGDARFESTARGGAKLKRRNVGPASLLTSRGVVVEQGPVACLLDVEGESDFLAALDAGYTDVLCSSGGAGSLKPYEENEDLLDAIEVQEVVVLRDRDNAGRLGQAKVAAWYRSRGFTVRTPTLPESLGEGGDLRDFLNGDPKRGLPPHTRSDLDALLKAAPVLPPLEDGDEGEAAHELTALLAPERTSVGRWFDAEDCIIPAPEPVWIIRDLILALVVGLIVAPGGTGKGFFEMLLAIAVALGERFGLFEVPRPRGVLVCSFEDAEDELHRRFEETMLLRGERKVAREVREQLAHRLHLVDLVGEPAAVLSDAMADAIIANARSISDCGLIILDPLGRMLPPDSPPINSQEGAGAIHRQLGRIAKETKAVVLLAHHVNKDAMRKTSGETPATAATGSQQLVDLSRFVLALKSMDEQEAGEMGLDCSEGGFLRCDVTKSNYAPRLLRPLILRRPQGAGGALEFELGARPKREVFAERILRAINEAVAENDGTPIGTKVRDDVLNEALGLTAKPARDHCERLLRQGLLTRGKAAKGAAKGGARPATWTLSVTGKARLSEGTNPPGAIPVNFAAAAARVRAKLKKDV